MKNVVLFGFMGTGKTVAGKRVARRLGMKLVDMDGVIEKREGRTISEIFAQKGEGYFREVESQVALELSGRQGLVIATGGGVVLDAQNVDALQSTGTGICLTASPEVIYERVKGGYHRPLLMTDDPPERIRELLRHRAPFYARVKHHIDTSELRVQDVVERILEIVRKDREAPAADSSSREAAHDAK